MSFFGSDPSVDIMPSWTPTQRKMAEMLFQYLMSALGGVGGLELYPGMKKLAQMTPYERMGLGILESYLTGKEPVSRESEDILRKYISGTYTGLQPEVTKRYLSQVVYAPMKERLIEETLPQIAASYGKGGAYFSTMRGRAETEATRKASEEASRIGEELAYRELEGARQRQMQALGLGLTYPLGKIGAAMQYGGLERQIGMLPYQDWLQAMQRRVGRESGLLSAMLGGLGVSPYTYVVSPGSQGMGSSLFGLIGSLLPLFL